MPLGTAKSVALAEYRAEDRNPADDNHEDATAKAREKGPFDESHYPNCKHSSWIKW